MPVSRRNGSILVRAENGFQKDSQRKSFCQVSNAATARQMLQWAHAVGYPLDEMTCANAAGGGNLKVLQWARANGCPWDKKTRVLAARKGYVER